MCSPQRMLAASQIDSVSPTYVEPEHSPTILKCTPPFCHSGNLWSFKTVVKPSFQEHCTKTCPPQWSMSRAEVAWASRMYANVWVKHLSCTIGVLPHQSKTGAQYCKDENLGFFSPVREFLPDINNSRHKRSKRHIGLLVASNHTEVAHLSGLVNS